MPTNITYQDDPDDENCEVQTLVQRADAIPNVGELVVLFDNETSDQGTPYIVTERFFWVWRDDNEHQHVTVIIRPRDTTPTPKEI